MTARQQAEAERNRLPRRWDTPARFEQSHLSARGGIRDAGGERPWKAEERIRIASNWLLAAITFTGSVAGLRVLGWL